MKEKVLKIASYYTPEANRIASDDNAPRFYFSGVYLHGEVERLCNYDICYPLNPEDFPEGVVDITTKYSGKPEPVTHPYLFLEGIFPCVVDGKYECTAFLWYDHEIVEQHKADSNTMRGLIVLKTDEEYMEDAREKYNKRSYCL